MYSKCYYVASIRRGEKSYLECCWKAYESYILIRENKSMCMSSWNTFREASMKAEEAMKRGGESGGRRKRSRNIEAKSRHGAASMRKAKAHREMKIEMWRNMRRRKWHPAAELKPTRKREYGVAENGCVSLKKKSVSVIETRILSVISNVSIHLFIWREIFNEAISSRHHESENIGYSCLKEENSEIQYSASWRLMKIIY